jgi:6,7-dimethyl-8-ribityllumazine synthase
LAERAGRSLILKTELHREESSAAGFRFCIVGSRWNSDLTSRLEQGAIDALSFAGAAFESIDIFHVPGSFELPLACLKAAETGSYDAVIALGIVIRGDTPHFEYVASQAASGIMHASLQTGVPVLFGVITADNMDQAVARAADGLDNKGYEAALSAVEMANLLRKMKQGGTDAKAFPHVVR